MNVGGFESLMELFAMNEVKEGLRIMMIEDQWTSWKGYT